MGTKPQEKQGSAQNAGMSTDSMQAMISADMSVKQANVNGSTAKKMEGKANILETEIKLDSARGSSSNVEYKEAQLAEAKEAAAKATASQMSSLHRPAKHYRTLQRKNRQTKRKQTKRKNREPFLIRIKPQSRQILLPTHP